MAQPSWRPPRLVATLWDVRCPPCSAPMLLAAAAAVAVAAALLQTPASSFTVCSDQLLLLCGNARRASGGNCLVCAGQHQSQLLDAGCNDPTIEAWCSGVEPPPPPVPPVGGRLVCFEGSGCVDLATVKSSSAQRALLNATCDPTSPLHFDWGTKTVNPCDFQANDWRNETCAQFRSIPGLTTTFWADMAAVRMQNWFAFPDSIGGTSKGIPQLLQQHNFTLPANFEIPLTLISSGLNRLRDLPNSSRALMFACEANTAPTKDNQVNDTRRSTAKVVFSGVDGQTSGKLHPKLPYCSAAEHANVSRFVVFDYTSTSLLVYLADNYAGAGGSMLVWETTSAGNQPFSGDSEWIVSPGATFKQLQCDRFALEHAHSLCPPGSLPPSQQCPLYNLTAVSFAYETTAGELPRQVELAVLRRLRDAFYNFTFPHKEAAVSPTTRRE